LNEKTGVDVNAFDAVKQQAQIWKQEANTANATIAEIYRLVGSKAGNWNGVEPVRSALAEPVVDDAMVARALAACCSLDCMSWDEAKYMRSALEAALCTAPATPKET
jgi:hypothetical protein